jgi:serine/threonine-protein kinase
MYEQMGRYQEAIQVFSRSIQRKPTDQAYSNLGTCYYYLGRYRDAAAAYENAIKLTPKQYLYWANLGDAYRWSPGYDNRAAEAYRKATALMEDELRLNPADNSVRGKLAECLAKEGKSAEASTEITRAIAAEPTNATLMYRAAIVKNTNGDTALAVQWLKNAVAHGYPRTEIERDPQFALLRSSDDYKKALQ